MPLLTDLKWKTKYSRDDGDLVAQFYVPALECAERYDRSTGYFGAEALALAARGIQGLLANSGRMRLIVGCTLDPPEVAAIEKGEDLRSLVDRRLATVEMPPPTDDPSTGLALLAALVARGHLQVRVAVPCDTKRRPVPSDGIFHSKTGILEDKAGNKIAFSGSLNETRAGWQTNFENFHVFTNWKPGGSDHVGPEEAEFERLWADQSPHAVVLDVPVAVTRRLLEYLPRSDRPATPKPRPQRPDEPPKAADLHAPVEPPPPLDANEELRGLVWGFIRYAATWPNGSWVGAATSAVEAWPHQVRAFDRMYGRWPPRLLIADEVGLGKTVEAGLLLRQAWLSGKAKRILVLVPAALTRQWQLELREKFNLNWPIYDGHTLEWSRTPLYPEPLVEDVMREDWHREPFVIVSSHLMRRADRVPEILERAEPWDLVILDEAHHARRRSFAKAGDDTPNALLHLMRGLRNRTRGLVLLTATPMQVHPLEVWDLLGLLGMPPEWSASAFLRYFELLGKPDAPDAIDTMARLFQATERAFGETEPADVQALEPGMSRLRANTILKALRSVPDIPRRRLGPADRKVALGILRRETPIRRLVSRHTRALLRKYRDDGRLASTIADRDVVDEFVELSPAERRIYDAVEDYISSTYNQASHAERNAVGFVMTVYRRRLASSFRALAETLQRRLDAMSQPSGGAATRDDDLPDDPLVAEPMSLDDAAKAEAAALALEERGDIADLLRRIRELPVDTKTRRLMKLLKQLREEGYPQVMIFTQFGDTMTFLRDHLASEGVGGIMCFSGAGGQVRQHDGAWQTVSREEIKHRFRRKEAEILLCTDAAAEGLNFQFCGALVNYDMPWNPMRVEQRIGRIDRLGQAFPRIRIVNMHYKDTVEADVYAALRQRIQLFAQFVGRLQPILARLPGGLRDAALGPAGERKARRDELVTKVSRDVESQDAFDLDDLVAAEFDPTARPAPPVTLDDLDLLVRTRALLPPGTEVRPLGVREYAAARGQVGEVRITTDPAYFDEHPESTELWSPGSEAFPDVQKTASSDDAFRSAGCLGELLGRCVRPQGARAAPK